MEEGFPEGKYYTQNSGILSCPHLKLAKLRGATYSSASAQSCFSLIRPDLAAVSCHQFTYYRQESLLQKCQMTPLFVAAVLIPFLCSPLHWKLRLIVYIFFFSSCKFSIDNPGNGGAVQLVSVGVTLATIPHTVHCCVIWHWLYLGTRKPLHTIVVDKTDRKWRAAGVNM